MNIDKLKKLITFLLSLGLPAKVITIIIVILSLIVILFFTPACAYKLHVDRIDNLTRSVDIYKK